MAIFEPVGTDPDFQRRGLGKAVLSEGFRRLRALGARVAYVNSADDNPASNALYEAVGFRLVDENHAWTKAL
jgi:mycothiol synthase